MVSKDSKFSKAVIWAGIGFIVLAMALMGASLAHGSTASPRHDNSLGVVIPYDNPYIYNFGAIVDGAIIVDPKSNKRGTNIRFQPFATFELYTENILFCGNRADDFRTATGPIVLTYKRVAHEMIDGVACHELEAITKVAIPKDEQ
jgi:hypothetical protein